MVKKFILNDNVRIGIIEYIEKSPSGNIASGIPIMIRDSLLRLEEIKEDKKNDKNKQ